MSRTWIEFLNCIYGYGINFDQIFNGTPYAIDEFRRGPFEEYEGYVEEFGEKAKEAFKKEYKHVNYDCGSLMLLEKEFKEYLAEFHPELKDVKNMPSIFITCDKFIGIDESYGHPDNVYVVFGYELGAGVFTVKKSDVKGMSINTVDFYFPDDAEAMYTDFITRFKAKHCVVADQPKKEKFRKVWRSSGSNYDSDKLINLGIFANNTPY